MVLLSII